MANPASWQEALVSDLPNSSAGYKSLAHCTQQRQERNTPTHKGKEYIITAEDQSRYLGKHSHSPTLKGRRRKGMWVCSGVTPSCAGCGDHVVLGIKEHEVKELASHARGKERKPVPQTQGIGYPHFLGGVGLRDLPQKPTQLRFS